jgi:hypothetical protein
MLPSVADIMMFNVSLPLHHFIDKDAPLERLYVTPTSTKDYSSMVWWMFLTVVSVVNIVAYIYQYRYHRTRDAVHLRMKHCAGMYVLACCTRAIWPRVDVERVCFWDAEALQTAFVGRSLATVAELAYVYQITSCLAQIASDLDHPTRKRIVEMCYWPFVLAETFSWMGVTTQRQCWQVLEESIWMIFIGLLGAIAMTMIPAVWPHKCIEAKIFLIFLSAISIPFVWFLSNVDIPMYYVRYQRDVANGMQYNSVLEGVESASRCHAVSRSIDVWAEEIPWMSWYFSLCVWFSIFMMRSPRVYTKAKTL